MERDILAEVDHPFIVRLHYGELRYHQVLDPIALVVGQAKTVTLRYMRNILLHRELHLVLAPEKQQRSPSSRCLKCAMV